MLDVPARVFLKCEKIFHHKIIPGQLLVYKTMIAHHTTVLYAPSAQWANLSGLKFCPVMIRFFQFCQFMLFIPVLFNKGLQLDTAFQLILVGPSKRCCVLFAIRKAGKGRYFWRRNADKWISGMNWPCEAGFVLSQALGHLDHYFLLGMAAVLQGQGDVFHITFHLRSFKWTCWGLNLGPLLFAFAYFLQML